MSGYSNTPLSKKLGIREQSRVRVEHAPSNYLELLRPLPKGAMVSSHIRTDIDIWHLFARSKTRLPERLEKAMKYIPESGMIWVSWPKKASGVASDMTEDVIREAALPLGLVDISVCAVDDVWSGLKLVIRKSNRK